jgi:hypothetical protein
MQLETHSWSIIPRDNRNALKNARPTGITSHLVPKRLTFGGYRIGTSGNSDSAPGELAGTRNIAQRGSNWRFSEWPENHLNANTDELFVVCVSSSQKRNSQMCERLCICHISLFFLQNFSFFYMIVRRSLSQLINLILHTTAVWKRHREEISDG